MSDVDSKNQIMIDYLKTCPSIKNSPLYFNFNNAKDNTNEIVTLSNDRYTRKQYVDGSVLKIYSFTILTYKSTAPNPIPRVEGYVNENVSDMDDVQKLIDWVQEQADLHNYPDFGEDYIVDDMYTLSENPVFSGIDDETSPPLAVYSTTIEIPYIDRTKQWR